MATQTRRWRGAWFAAAAGLVLAWQGSVGAQTPAPATQAPAEVQPPELQSETLDIAPLPPGHPGRLYFAPFAGGVFIYDVNKAKIEGTVTSAPYNSAFAVGPQGRRIYVAETMWTKNNRGQRLDMISVYDGSSLELLHEINLPGRLIAGMRKGYFGLSADGRLGYVFNIEPATSVIAVDLEKRKVGGVIETPGCGVVFAVGNDGFATLCADGTLSRVTLDAKLRPTVAKSNPFFDAEQDPVFEESLIDPKTGKGLLVTYTGQVFAVDASGAPKVEEGWSLQAAAGISPATTKPDHETWRPGGHMLMAYHRASGRLYILMHTGKHWSQGAAGREIWVADVATKKVIKRITLPTSADGLAVTQDAEPTLYAFGGGSLWVLNPATGDTIRHVREFQSPRHAVILDGQD